MSLEISILVHDLIGSMTDQQLTNSNATTDIMEPRHEAVQPMKVPVRTPLRAQSCQLVLDECRFGAALAALLLMGLTGDTQRSAGVRP